MLHTAFTSTGIANWHAHTHTHVLKKNINKGTPEMRQKKKPPSKVRERPSLEDNMPHSMQSTAVPRTANSPDN